MKLGYLVVVLFLGLVMIGCVATPPEVPPPPPPPPPCEGKGCFTTAANDCKTESVTLTESYGVIEFSTKNCVLTKTIISLDPSEDEGMKALLEGKSVTCKYEKGKFNSDWMDSLLMGIETCEGDLRETLSDLLVFA